MKIFAKRLVLTLLVAPLTVFSLAVGWFVFLGISSYSDHNQKLREYEAIYHEMPHPLNTSAVKFESRIAPPPGNGGNCFYYVGEIRQFSGSRAEIKAFYSSQKVSLAFFEVGRFDDSIPLALHQLLSWQPSSDDSAKNFYLVYTMRTDYEENILDLRCA